MKKNPLKLEGSDLDPKVVNEMFEKFGIPYTAKTLAAQDILVYDEVSRVHAEAFLKELIQRFNKLAQDNDEVGTGVSLQHLAAARSLIPPLCLAIFTKPDDIRQYLQRARFKSDEIAFYLVQTGQAKGPHEDECLMALTSLYCCAPTVN